MKKILKILSKIIIIFVIYLCFDILFMKFLPLEIKSKIFDKRSHKIKSYYYHHDLGPNGHWIERWGYAKSRIYTNNLGFKDKKIRTIDFKKNNILFIGDSFTEGVGVEFENSFVGIIEKIITKRNTDFTVLNAGVASYSPIIILSKLHYIIKNETPITKVFVVICEGDFYDDIFRYKSIDANYIVEHDDFINNKILISSNNFIKSNTLLYQFIKEIFPLSNLIARLKNMNKKKEGQKYSEEQILVKFSNKEDWAHVTDERDFSGWGIRGLEKSTIYLKKINELLKKNNIDLTLIFIEEAVSMLNRKDTTYYKNHWTNFSKKNDVDFIFIEDYHLNNKDKFKVYKNLFFQGDNHFNNMGNKMIANEIMHKSKFLKNFLN